MVLPIIFGAAQAGLGILGGISSYQAQKQDYVNQKAFQNANSQYASWQAGFNRRVTDANAQYNYWQETVNYNQNLAYSRSLQNYELLKEINQAEVVGKPGQRLARTSCRAAMPSASRWARRPCRTPWPISSTRWRP